MKFQIKINVSTEKTGPELDELYDRLGFPEEHRPEKFGKRNTTIVVSKEFAREHRGMFNELNRAEIEVPAEKTTPADWQDWGTHGVMLNYEKFDEKWIESHI